MVIIQLECIVDGWSSLLAIDFLRKHDAFNDPGCHTSGIALSRLAHASGVNEASLRQAFRILLKQGVVTQLAEDCYAIPLHAAVEIPRQYEDLISLAMPDVLGESSAQRLQHWLAYASSGWPGCHARMAACLDGALLAPLLAALERAGGAKVLEGRAPGAHISEASVMALRNYFASRGWGERSAEGFRLNQTGQALLDGCASLSAARLFRPAVTDREGPSTRGGAVHARLDPAEETESKDQGSESLDALDAVVAALFDQPPLAEQARCIVDVDCADGVLLRRLYEAVSTRSVRGQHLQRHPLTLIGLCADRAARQRAARDLQNLPHLLLDGGIDDPQELLAKLRRNGIEDTQSMLLVRDSQDVRRAWHLPASEMGVDHQYIEPAAAWQSLVECLTQWQSVTTGQGFIMLESHCPSGNGADSGSRHWGAERNRVANGGFEAPEFLMAAAEAGLFPERATRRIFTRAHLPTRSSLTHFKPRRFRIRHPVVQDLPLLHELESACWPKGLGATAGALRRRVLNYPRGQLVMECDGELVAAVYSQRLAAVEPLLHTDSEQAEMLHDGSGPVAHLLGICVKPERQGEGLADELIDFMLTYLSSYDDIQSVVGVTRCHHYDGRKPGAMPIQEYIHLRDKTSGHLREPMLCFHETHGAQISCAIHNYRPGDDINGGAGVLVEYHHLRDVAQRKRPAAAKPLAETARDWASVVRDLLMETLGEAGADGYGEHVPLMEMGFTSLQMLELRHRLARQTGSPLDATFFFHHGTPGAIVAYLQDKHAQPAPEPAPLSHRAGADANLEGIAIVGVGCRFPGGCSSPEHFWTLLQEGVDAIGQRDAAALSSSLSGGFVDHVASFDARFFRISPREAQLIDPRQRVLLETAWEALEQGGFMPADLRGSNTGVFMGLMGHGYDVLLRKAEAGHETKPGFATGNAASIAAGRLSYFFDWHGPALTIDTACSSSLVAINMACDSLLAGKCDMALAGGVNLLLDDDESEAFRGAGMLSPRGRCSTFDEEADGYVRGEGCGVVVLKRLADAQANADPIWAVIRGSAINHDGAGAGLTVPNPSAQSAVIEAALRQAKLAPHQVQYLEAHGTGTRLGDPIEVQAAAQALGMGRGHGRPLLLGSVKTNLGHLEAAAGVAGVIKVLLAMRHGMIPRQLHFNTPNSALDWRNLPVQVVDKHREWFDGPKIAGVSSFGFSGTNAHVVLQAWEPVRVRNGRTRAQAALIVLSARTHAQLLAGANNLRESVVSGRFDDAELPDIAYTLQIGREAMPYRLALIASSLNELAMKLTGLDNPLLKHADLWFGAPGQNDGSLPPRDAMDAYADAADSPLLQLKTLAQRWLSGEAVDWAQLYIAPLPRRVSLPTYPFARELCSIPNHNRIGGIKMVHHLQHAASTSPQGEPESQRLQPREPDESDKGCQQESGIRPMPASSVTRPSIQESGATTAERRAELERELALSLAEALYLRAGEVGVDQPFVDLGLDSVIGVEWIREINRTYGLSLNALVVYEHSTVRLMADFIAQTLRIKQEGQRLSLPQEPPVEQSTFEHAAEPAHFTAERSPANDSIAIIGISGRYPGATTLDAYWDNLAHGRDCVEEIPPSRWRVTDYFDAEIGKAGKTYGKWLGRLDNIDCFDPLFFNMSPAEAEWVDPQQRLFLEEGYKAFEDAGYPAGKLNDTRCGVYLGIMGPSEYGWFAQQQRGPAEVTGRSEAIAAARLAYFLNLKGPAILVDTACSSSLVATHLACQALRTGEVDIALAGGSTLYLSPEMYISMCKTGMLSPTGKCRTLDNAADGMVPGEGVGALVLKRLADAERDGDRIHGVIVASGINQDGKTNGITVPSATSQIELEREVYARYGIDPQSISYVELHGTGTKLGDPIELRALNTVFSEQTDKRNYCALGSVKSNIGHTTAAAGMAGVHKVLLQMKHRELVPTLHFETPNEHFDFAGSPFFVSTRHQPWLPEEGKPLRAAVSAFGISGTNAHLVIDAYRPVETSSQPKERQPVLVVLSAQRADRLKEYAERMKQFIDSQHEIDLTALAYTLQTGRDAFEHRLAVTASSRQQLTEALDDFINNRVSPRLLIGGPQSGKDVASVLAGEKAFDHLLQDLLANHRLSKLAELWVGGVDIPWIRLYPNRKPVRLSLPNYPFAQERCWVVPEGVGCISSHRSAQPLAVLHPLLERNSSTLSQLRYSTRLSGDEEYLRDHVIAGRPVVPGVVLLEWARAACALACELPLDAPLVLEHVSWMRPLIVEAPLEVHIRLAQEPGAEVSFEIYSEAGENRVVYSQGIARFAAPEGAPRLDLASLRHACDRSIEGDAWYADCESRGLHYGVSLRALRTLQQGPDIAIVRLEQPIPPEGYTLSPALLDGALQPVNLTQETGKLQLPFTVRKVEQWPSVLSPAWAVVRKASENSVDVHLVDDDGRVAVRLSGFQTRPLEEARMHQDDSSLISPSEAEEVMVAPYWQPVGDQLPDNGFTHQETVEIPAEMGLLWREEGGQALCESWLKAHQPFNHLVWHVPAKQRGVAQVGLLLIKALLALDYGPQPFALTVVTRQAMALWPSESGDPQQASVHGVMGSFAKEFTHWQITLLDLPLDSACRPRSVSRYQGETLVERGGQWYLQRLQPCALPAPAETSFRHGGVYVILGGAGGIGIAFSEYLVRRYQAQVVWLGRRQADPAIERHRQRLAQFGPMPLYLAADACDQAALEAARRTIHRHYGAIHGVVHAAIVLGDSSIMQMSADRFECVLQAKIATSENLDAVFGGESLDFMMYFSSMQSFIRAPGQSNYAAGCCFSDAFALQQRSRPYPIKVVHWGYWGSIGVAASDAYRQRMDDAGVGSIEPPEAMAALERFLASPLPSLAYFKMKRGHILSAWYVDLDREQHIALSSAPVSLRGVSAVPRPECVAAAFAELDSCLAKYVKALLTEYGWNQGKEALSEGYVEWRDDARLLLHSETTAPDASAQSAWRQQWGADRERLLNGRYRDILRSDIRLLDEVLPVLPEVLRGEQSATDVLFPDARLDLVEGIYHGNPFADYFNEVLCEQLLSYVTQRLARDPQARLRIIEIGAGTGGASALLLARLTPYASAIADYQYTDVSEVFLMHARGHYAPQHAYLKTGILDIERSPSEQGFDLGQYDVVIASNVLHATRDIRRTLRHVKSLLRGNGLLLLNELAQTSLFMHATFGLLHGWRMAKDSALRIPGSPALSPQTWRQLLTEGGFYQVNLPTEQSHGMRLQVLTASSDGVIELARQAAVETPRPAVTEPVKPALQTPSRQDAYPQQGKNVASIQVIYEAFFDVLKLEKAQLQEDRAMANYGVDSITGIALINAINRRLGLRLAVTVLFDYPSINKLAQYLDGERRTLHEDACAESPPPLAVPKTAAAGAVKEDMRMPIDGAQSHRSEATPPDVVTAAAGSVRFSRHLQIEGPGRLDELQLVETPLNPLQPDEVRIEVRAFSLNFGDLLCVSGLYPTQPDYPFTPGFEACGVVIEVGAGVSHLEVGDAVIALGDDELGAHTSVMTSHQHRVFPMPEGMSFEDGCALPVVALTMIESFARAQVKAGERVLIQTATGGTGLIAIQLARHAGATIIATAGSQAKLDHLAELGVEHRINYQQEDFEAAVMRLTQGKGVDVVINTLAGEAIQKGLNCLGPGGRYIELAMTALKSAHTINLSKLNSNQTFISIDLRRLEKERPGSTQALAQEMMALYDAGVIHPTISHVFDFERVQEAYRYLADRRNIGKVVVRVPAASPAPGRPQAKKLPEAAARMGQPAPAAVKTPASPAADTLPEPIAIIGMSGRFASADGLDELWQAVSEGNVLFSDVTRWDLSRHYPADAAYCRRGGFLNDIDGFDPLFFNISGREAAVMDPQQRLFLEEAWHALEDAGYAGDSVDGLRCGVYVGCTAGEYLKLLDLRSPAHAFWGNASSVIPARIAYHLNLQGPAVAIDTACSSSLVALHQACQGLRCGDTELAIAGGVFVQSTERFYLQAQQANMLSPTGRCYPFDARANGFVPGEGVGAVILKRLSQALADGDAIHGVIQGSGINQDGATNGLTAPSALAQTRLMLDVYQRHAIDIENIGLVETHGTGTVLGDPTEFKGLMSAFTQAGRQKGGCALGSIKNTVGHHTTAAGIASVIKVLLALRHRQIPPAAYFTHPNPHIDLSQGPFYVPTTKQEWKKPDNGARLAAISSFGFGGTNGHIVIGEAPVRATSPASGSAQLVVLSAMTLTQLQTQVKNLLAHLAKENVELEALSHTLLTGRRHFEYRLGCVCASIAELCEQLSQWLADGRLANGGSGQAPKGDAAEILQESGQRSLRRLEAAREPGERHEALLSLAHHYINGGALDWRCLFAARRPGRVWLPTYPFEKQRYWVPSDTVDEPDDAAMDSAQAEAPTPLPPTKPETPLPDGALDAEQAPLQAKPQRLKLRAMTERQDAVAQTRGDDERRVRTLSPMACSAPAISCTQLESELGKSLSRMLNINISHIQPDRPFASMGMDSIIAVEWAREIGRCYSLEIGATAVYKHPTLAQMAVFVAAELENFGANAAESKPEFDRLRATLPGAGGGNE